MKLSEELQWRGFVNQTTFKDIAELDKEPLTFYWGVDPSAQSMTIGNLAAAMMVRHFIDHGHKAILLIGGATGMIGDPDGKSEERDLKSMEEITINKASIANQYKQIFSGQEFQLVDNYDWFKNMNYLEFLRDVGKHVPIRQMLSRDFVQSRLSETGAGISYAEFSYSLIQGYDFLHMFREMHVTLQVAASDQWGNSIAGVELIRRITGQEAHVWTTPLIINKATGKKFGKTEDGAIWLDPNMTSPYKFYQFWLNVDDEGVDEYLKVYTLLSINEVQQVMTDFQANRGQRLAQKTLAYEVTKLVHGQEQADRQKRIAESLFGESSLEALSEAEFMTIGKEIPYFEIVDGSDVIPTLVEGGLAASNTEAKRFLNNGAIYINNEQISSGSKTLVLNKDGTLYDYALIRRGKNTQLLVKIK